jgi:Family of unknown function (DUF6338)
MPPATGTALLILVAFVLPGFVAVLLKERIYEVRGEESTFDRVLTTAYYSVLVYLLPAIVVGGLSAAGLVGRDDLERFFAGEAPLWLTGLVAALVLLVVPAAAALAAWWWVRSARRLGVLDRLGIRRTHRVATSWDYSFDHEQDLLLVVTLRGGERVAGYYGRRSHSGWGTRTRDLFLEERWEFDDAGHELTGPPPATSASGSRPRTSSWSSSTLRAMSTRRRSPSPNGSAPPPRPTPPGTGERGRQPTVSHPKPAGPVPVGKPISRGT